MLKEGMKEINQTHNALQIYLKTSVGQTIFGDVTTEFTTTIDD